MATMVGRAIVPLLAISSFDGADHLVAIYCQVALVESDRPSGLWRPLRGEPIHFENTSESEFGCLG